MTIRLPLEFDLHGEPGDIAGSAVIGAGFNLSCCPFCCGTNVEAENSWTPYYSVVCSDCGAEGPTSDSPKRSSFATEAAAKRAHRRAITQAVERWERRL